MWLPAKHFGALSAPAPLSPLRTPFYFATCFFAFLRFVSCLCCVCLPVFALFSCCCHVTFRHMPVFAVFAFVFAILLLSTCLFSCFVLLVFSSGLFSSRDSVDGGDVALRGAFFLRCLDFIDIYSVFRGRADVFFSFFFFLLFCLCVVFLQAS